MACGAKKKKDGLSEHLYRFRTNALCDLGFGFDAPSHGDAIYVFMCSCGVNAESVLLLIVLMMFAMMKTYFSLLSVSRLKSYLLWKMLVISAANRRTRAIA